MFRECIKEKQQEVAFHEMLSNGLKRMPRKSSCRGVEADYEMKPPTQEHIIQ